VGEHVHQARNPAGRAEPAGVTTTRRPLPGPTGLCLWDLAHPARSHIAAALRRLARDATPDPWPSPSPGHEPDIPALCQGPGMARSQRRVASERKLGGQAATGSRLGGGGENADAIVGSRIVRRQHKVASDRFVQRVNRRISSVVRLSASSTTATGLLGRAGPEDVDLTKPPQHGAAITGWPSGEPASAMSVTCSPTGGGPTESGPRWPFSRRCLIQPGPPQRFSR
jgi:hypothetical protein